MENDIIILEDENGNEVKFEAIDVFELYGTVYFALLELLNNGVESDEVLLMKVDDTDEENPELMMITDEDELNGAFDEFLYRQNNYDGTDNSNSTQTISAKQNRLNKLAQQLGAPEYKTLTGSSIFTVDIEHKLFHYEDSETGKLYVETLDNIIYCESEPEIEHKNVAAKTGFIDGVLSGITGVGIIRDASTLQEAYPTGRIIVKIKFILNNKIYQSSVIYNTTQEAAILETTIKMYSKYFN